MTVKSIATGVAAVAAIGAAAAGVTAMTSTVHPAASQVQPVVFDAPLPMDQTTAVPTADQLTSVLSTLANPGVPFQSKGNLVEGGVGPGEGAMADHALKKAAKKGELPLSFSVTNIQPAGPGSATADVTVSGPKLAPTLMNTTFVDQGGWTLSHDSAMSLLQAASAS